MTTERKDKLERDARRMAIVAVRALGYRDLTVICADCHAARLVLRVEYAERLVETGWRCFRCAEGAS